MMEVGKGDTAIETANKSINPPGGLKGYTVIEVLTPDMEFERENWPWRMISCGELSSPLFFILLIFFP